MKRFYTIVILLMLAIVMMGQPDWAKKASKSVFTLKTFDADGALLFSANGFFVGNGGEAVASHPSKVPLELWLSMRQVRRFLWSVY